MSNEPTRHIRGVLLDVSPSWWREVHRRGGESPVALALQIVFEAAEDQEIPLLEMHVGADALTILVDADNLLLGPVAHAIVQHIEQGIAIEESDRIRRPAAREAEKRVSREDLVARLEACGFSLTPGSLDTGDDIWTIEGATGAGSVFVALPADGRDDNQADYGSAADVNPKSAMSYAAVMKKLAAWQSGSGIGDVVPGNIFEQRGI